MLPVLTAAQMSEVDRRTAELGIPLLVLMENAGARVVEAMASRFLLPEQDIAVFCGKGNNGGDGLVIARQLFTRFAPRSLTVVLIHPPDQLSAEAAANLRMLEAAGCPFTREFPTRATLVVDALLGTGLHGPAGGPALAAIRHINGYAGAKVVAVDLPSGLSGDAGALSGEFVRADLTVTFTAPKPAHVLGPACYCMGEIVTGAIGSPEHLLASEFGLVQLGSFRRLFDPRPRDSNKGMFGHVLAVAGSRGRTGAAAMCGAAALRSGAGLVTVASAASAIELIAAYMPELMTEALPETPKGQLASNAIDAICELAKTRTVLAIGPGLGTDSDTASVVRRLFQESALPVICDADALTVLAGHDWAGGTHLRVLTPHPGEMSRLTGLPVPEVQRDRPRAAQTLARERRVVVVLKGDRTLIAFPDGRVWVNPTGSPGMATGGTGDILTGLIAGLIAQHPKECDLAIAAAVYLHGLAGELAAAELTEQCLIATDLLRFLPHAIRNVQIS